MTFLVLVGGGKSPPHTKYEVLGGAWSLATLLGLCAMFPSKKYSSGVSNFVISPIKTTSPSKHRCN